VEELMSVQTLNPAVYGKLLARMRPRPIQDEREYDRVVGEIRRLMDRGEENLSVEETSLLEMMSILVEDYDRRRHPLPPLPPHEMVAYLIEQRGLKARDLWPVLGSKGRVSEILAGKRPVSKAQAKKLAGFFHVSTDLFI
jgi:HTH-type transcriptional regulator / antitoxin HigA